MRLSASSPEFNITGSDSSDINNNIIDSSSNNSNNNNNNNNNLNETCKLLLVYNTRISLFVYSMRVSVNYASCFTSLAHWVRGWNWRLVYAAFFPCSLPLLPYFITATTKFKVNQVNPRVKYEALTRRHLLDYFLWLLVVCSCVFVLTVDFTPSSLSFH